MKRGDGKTCLACSSTRLATYKAWWCEACHKAREKVRTRAVRAVAKAVSAGALPRPSERACVDCGAAASDWDHRDYARPLDVAPVCRSCNLKRGPAQWQATPHDQSPALEASNA